MRRLIHLFALCALLLMAATQWGWAQTTAQPLWRNPDKPIDQRVDDLMSQLTEKEKISLLYFLAPAIDRLGIPAYDHGNECLHGLVRPGKNTVFPQAIALGATFDPDLIKSISSSISDEARARWNQAKGQHLGMYSDVLTLWSPVVNMARDPRWGRTQEGYGEDPWLTSRIGVAFVQGLQGDDPHYLKVIATPKHFAGNNEEAGRFSKSITCDERYVYEYELFPFSACIREGHAESIMAAYTAINGVPSSANPWLLTYVLRKQWGFQGYVVSDCGAISHVVDSFNYAPTPEKAVADCLNAGLDMEGGLDAKYPDVMNNYLSSALQQGLVTQEVVDNALRLVLPGRFRLGMYDPPERVPYSKIPMSVIGSPEHLALARKAADESMVLLKNEPVDKAPLLPIDPAKTKTIALVGPYVDIANLGDYSGSPTGIVTILQGMQERAARAGNTVVSYPWQPGKLEVVPTDALAPKADGGPNGLNGEYYATEDLSGPLATTRIDRQLNFNWAHVEPDPYASAQVFGVRWTGLLKAVVAGSYQLSVEADGGFRVYLDNKEIIDRWKAQSPTRSTAIWKTDSLEAGNHALKVEYHHNGGEAGMVLRWQTPVDQDYLSELRKADMVVAVMGLSTEYESEGRDRPTLHLPKEQEDFMAKVRAMNPHLVLVLESGSSLAFPWASANVPCILQTWYPGQEGGHALADILYGVVNPSGRLPLTFYRDDDQLRPMNEYDLTKGRTYMYLTDKPAYAFGHGLSYTTFKYDQLQFSAASIKVGQPLTASLNVTNNGKVDGDEVVQVYVHTQQSSVPMPTRQLWGFQRVHLAHGESKPVTITLDSSRFGHWDTVQQKFVVEPGTFDIQVGSASDDIRLKQTIPISN